MADIIMNDITILQIELQNDLFEELKYISDNFGTDLQTDIMDLLQRYVAVFRQMRSDPAGKILLGGK